MKTVGRFEKVSFEQFKKDWIEIIYAIIELRDQGGI